MKHPQKISLFHFFEFFFLKIVIIKNIFVLDITFSFKCTGSVSNSLTSLSIYPPQTLNCVLKVRSDYNLTITVNFGDGDIQTFVTMNTEKSYVKSYKASGVYIVSAYNSNKMLSTNYDVKGLHFYLF